MRRAARRRAFEVRGQPLCDRDPARPLPPRIAEGNPHRIAEHSTHSLVTPCGPPASNHEYAYILVLGYVLDSFSRCYGFYGERGTSVRNVARNLFRTAVLTED